jgi:hypothetical protein
MVWPFNLLIAQDTNNHIFITQQQDYHDVISRMTDYGCPDLSAKIAWPEDDKAVAGGLYDIYKGKLPGYESVVAVKYSTHNDIEVSTVFRYCSPNQSYYHTVVSVL